MLKYHFNLVNYQYISIICLTNCRTCYEKTYFAIPQYEQRGIG